MSKSHLQNLNDPQLEAVTTVKGPLLILAGAGSGKTRVLTRRVVHLVLEHGIAPHRILAVTFTNKATREMQERIRQLLSGRSEDDASDDSSKSRGRPGWREPWVATFHSTALRILRRHAHILEYTSDFVVYDAQDSLSLLKQVLKKLNVDDKKYPVNLFRRAIDRAKNDFILPDEYAKDASSTTETLVAEVYDTYQRELFKSNAMDFGDLLVNVLRLFQGHPDICRMYQEQFQYILVDEFQDTNKVQYLLVRLLCEPQKNLLVVGDDDQAIYAFRGATVENILNFEKDFPNAKIIKLEQNYRSTATILEAAHAVICRNPDRKEKKLWTAGEAGSKIAFFRGNDELEEAAFVAAQIADQVQGGDLYSSFAIFYRTNAQSRALEEALMTRGIPYRIYGGQKFYDRKEVKDILAYLKLLVNDRDSQSFLRTINTPTRGVGAQSVAKIASVASEQGSTLWEAAAEVSHTNKNVYTFVTLIQGLKELAATVDVSELIHQVVEKTGYGPKLRATKDVTAESRLENLEELRAIALSLPELGEEPLENLRTFLDRVSLSTADEVPEVEVHDPQKSSGDPTSPQPPLEVVSLMTLHLAKGLEYPTVFLTGFEEGLLPHYRSIDDPASVAEERRLCYVGMTRAIQRLLISRTDNRGMFSAGGGGGAGGRIREASRFSFDIPTDYASDELSRFLSSPFESDIEYDQSEDITFEPDESLQHSSGFQRGKNKERRSGSKMALLHKVQSADALVSRSDYTEGLPRAELSDMTPGRIVVHPSFGDGTVEEVKESSNDDPKRTKISVRFHEAESRKTVVFKYARLALRE